uniref:Uncharacterized protein n=1 Tax=Clastoptera arizonana TaxID=38151 RepID=A0A1B6EAB4_9HEMI
MAKLQNCIILYFMLYILCVCCSIHHSKRGKINLESNDEDQLVNSFLNSKLQDSENEMVDNFIAKYVVFREEQLPCQVEGQHIVEYDDTEHESLQSTQSTDFNEIR